jgi:hypothetical protein
MTQLPFHPTIRLIFKGFIITHITDGAVTAKMESLRNSLCHKPTISITEITPDDEEHDLEGFKEFSPEKPFSLDIEGAKYQGIQTLQKDNDPFNRLDDENDALDFRWFIDLNELHDKPLVIDTEKVDPIITIDNGLFYSTQLSTREARLKRHDAAGRDLPLKRLGKFAAEIAGHIYLNDQGSKVVFKYGDDEVPLKPESRYIMVFDCICHVDPEESDFPLVYEAIGVQGAHGIEPLSQVDRVELISDPPSVTTTPGTETYCLGGNVHP